MKEVMELSMGNPGAMTCLIGLLEHKKGSDIIKKVKEYEIKGTDLYILWSDISSKNYDLMAYLCEIVQKELLVEASSKQDRSGRELLEEYVEIFNN